MIYLCSEREDVPFAIGDIVEWGFDKRRGCIVAFEDFSHRELDEPSNARYTCLIADYDQAVLDDGCLEYYISNHRDNINLSVLEDDSVLKEHFHYGWTWEDHNTLKLISAREKIKNLYVLLNELEKEVE